MSRIQRLPLTTSLIVEQRSALGIAEDHAQRRAFRPLAGAADPPVARVAADVEVIGLPAHGGMRGKRPGAVEAEEIVVAEHALTHRRPDFFAQEMLVDEAAAGCRLLLAVIAHRALDVRQDAGAAAPQASKDQLRVRAVVAHVVEEERAVDPCFDRRGLAFGQQRIGVAQQEALDARVVDDEEAPHQGIDRVGTFRVHLDELRAGLAQSPMHVLGHGVIEIDAACPPLEQFARHLRIHDRGLAISRVRAEQRKRDDVFFGPGRVEGRGLDRRVQRDGRQAVHGVRFVERAQSVAAQFVVLAHQAA